MAIVATAGASNANSYETLLEAQAYFDNRLDVDAWTTSIEQEEALLQACWILEQFDYYGVPVTSTQALKWPRYDDDGVSLIRNYAINVVPVPIKNAQSEVALWLLQTGGSGVSISAAGVKSMKIGNTVEIQYETGTSTSAVVDTSVDIYGLPIQAARWLKGLRYQAMFA